MLEKHKNHQVEYDSCSTKTWRVVTYDSFQDLPNAIITAFEMAEKNDFQSGLDWYKILYGSVPALSTTSKLYVLFENDEPTILLPVTIKKEFALSYYSIYSLSNFYTALYTPILSYRANTLAMTHLLKSILTDTKEVTHLNFSPMDTSNEAYKLLYESLARLNYFILPYFCFGNWYQPISSSWIEYFQKRNGMLRSTIKRMSRRFYSAGGSLEVIFDDGNIAEGLAAYQKVYASSWKNPEPYREFIPNLVHTYASRGWLRLGIAYLGSKPIAAQIWIVANGKASIYKLAYDEDYKHYSPGTLLTAALMEKVIERGDVCEVDYLTGDDTYKKEWMSCRRERWGLVAYNPKTLGGVFGLTKEIASRVLKIFFTRLNLLKKQRREVV